MKLKIQSMSVEDKVCSAESCDRIARAKGLCDAHYNRSKGYAGLQESKSLIRRTEKTECTVKDCSKTAVARKLCPMHLRRFYKTGDVGPAGWVKKVYPEGHDNGQGYLRTSRANGRVMMHRLAMEEHLGRKLYKDENVHHLNGDRKDNRIENLELWSSRQAPGQRVEDKVQYAKEILARYEMPAFMVPVTSRRGLALLGE